MDSFLLVTKVDMSAAATALFSDVVIKAELVVVIFLVATVDEVGIWSVQVGRAIVRVLVHAVLRLEELELLLGSALCARLAEAPETKAEDHDGKGCDNDNGDQFEAATACDSAA